MTQNDQPEDLIRYDVLTQEALRDVIRKVLEEVAAIGLPGEHHFFITFQTDHPGVRLSARMRERYPEEMTIVIQHSFWDLNVSENHFEIDLSFDDILERLRIPFSSLKGFFDPHVKFGVQFDTEYLQAANADTIEEEAEGDNPDNLPQVAQTREVTKAKPKKAPKAKVEEEPELVNEPVDEEQDEAGSAEIVSLDQFRNKQ
ncbi:MAG: ClpXP protease specificity-enhancing factor SspB [Pseudomonadota bacterium]